MVEAVLDSWSEKGVEVQKTWEEIESLISGCWVAGFKVQGRPRVEGFYIRLGFKVCQERELVFMGGTYHIENDIELVWGGVGGRRFIIVIWWKGETGASREKGLSIVDIGKIILHHGKELGKDTTYSPYIDGFIVVFFE